MLLRKGLITANSKGILRIITICEEEATLSYNTELGGYSKNWKKPTHHLLTIFQHYLLHANGRPITHVWK